MEPDPIERELEDLGSDQKEPAGIELALIASTVTILTAESSLDQIAAALRKLAELAKDMDPLSRAAIREGAMRKLQAIGIKSPAGMVDAAIGTVSGDRDESSGMTFVEPMPWSEPVDADDLLNDIASAFCRYLIMSSHDATAAALWAVLTYLSGSTWTLPLLVITSPEKRCGKTLLLKLLQALVYRPLPASNISAASLFRVVEAYRPTLLIDEADSFLADNEELRGIINSGHRKSSAFVLRCDGDSLEPKSFSTWCPKAIALIGQAPDTIIDRSVVIRLRRKKTTESVERFRLDRVAKELEQVRRKLARWSRDNGDSIKNADPAMPLGLHDRAMDNWRPLMAIAELAGGTWCCVSGPGSRFVPS